MQVQIATSEKCSHQWIMRVANPLKCPKCGYVRGAQVRNKKATGQARNHIPVALGPSTHREVK